MKPLTTKKFIKKDDVVIQPHNIVIPITKWFAPSTKQVKKGK